ncbi:MAG: choice-of-anchor H family protein [Woeseiaceae bacterium]|nr:choice-of-anchor H family protein [Woeseiaceae bacterium]
MSREITLQRAVRGMGRIPLILVVAGLLPFTAGAAPADATADSGAGENRVSTSRQIGSGGREGTPGEAIEHAYGALETAGDRKQAPGVVSGKTEGAASSTSGQDFWFYTADVVLFNDDDGDGYFHGVDLLFDADTYFEFADVYAAVYLSYEGGPWNEYAVTDDFTIYGATSDDEYVVVTELQTGYPRGSYDLLIELYDAWDGAFLASFGPADTSELAYLPLEDFNRDAPRRDEVVVGRHGGGTGFGLALLLLPLAASRFSRRWPAAADVPCA